MPDEFDIERLRRITSEMVTAITSPPFVDAMRALRATPVDKRLVEGARLLSPDILRAQGVPLPAGMRISSRYFERGSPELAVDDAGAMFNDGINAASGAVVDVGGCACGGGLSFCGGAGGST